MRPYPLEVWCDALAQATRQPARHPPRLFLEDRVGLTVCGGTEEAVGSRVGRIHGLLCEAGPRRAHLSSPTPGSAAALVRATASGEAPPAAEPELQPDEALGGNVDRRAAVRLVEDVIEVVAREAPRARAAVLWVGFQQRVVVARPDRPPAHDVRHGARLRLQVSIPGRGPHASAVVETDLLSYRGDHAELARQAIDRAQARAGAEQVPGGLTVLVLGPGVGGVLIHELVGHALEADVAGRGTWLSTWASPSALDELTVVDDPRRGRAPWHIDDDGNPVQAVALFRAGRPAGLLHDQASALRSGASPNGHGRRSSYRDPVRPRMGCTFIAPGTARPEDILHGVATGVLVHRMESATTDPITGRATFRITDADRVLQGRAVAPLEPMIAMVDAREALASIDPIGDDLTFDTCIGSCHRDGQTIAIGVGAPTIRLGVATVVR